MGFVECKLIKGNTLWTSKQVVASELSQLQYFISQCFGGKMTFDKVIWYLAVLAYMTLC